MRTTLTIDPEIAERLKQEVALGKYSFKAIVNDALRKGLGMEEPKRAKPYRVKPHPAGLLPGIDPTKLNQIVDELEVDAFVAKHEERLSRTSTCLSTPTTPRRRVMSRPGKAGALTSETECESKGRTRT